jgi:hypothetical protein
MRKYSRRRFIGQLIAASIGSTASTRAGSANIERLNVGLAELCVIAREPGILPNAVLDVWTGQIGIIDFAQLPDHLGRVVIWDDIRGDRSLSREIANILCAIEEYFGITPNLGSNASVHAGHSSGLSCSIEMLLRTFQPGYPNGIGDRIAVIDLSSCGLTCLHWLDVIPLMRRHYTRVIGVHYGCPEFCELDTDLGSPHGLSRRDRDAMRACDYWLLTSDESICPGGELSPEQRSLEFTKLIDDLCSGLASAADDIESAVGSIAERRFALHGAGA